MGIIFSFSFLSDGEEGFQSDADVIRMEDVLYWSELIDEYHQKNGAYPLQDIATSSEDYVLVRVATAEQQSYFDKESPGYREELDNNISGRFKEVSVSDFVIDIENGLGREIDEHYDIQKVPTNSPVWYNYFVSQDGYLFWVTCITCEVNWATTLLSDGHTPTINIGSPGITEGSMKLYTREEIIKLPDFKKLMERKLQKEEYIRSLQSGYFNETKAAY
jgi:hypothetical protein